MLSFPAAAQAQAPAAGTVSVALVGASSDDQPFADAVGQALGDRSFTILPGHSRYLAEVSIARVRQGVAATRVPKEKVVASPLAVNVPLPSHKTQLRDLVRTTLTVRLVTRADRSPVWSGSALTVAVDDAPVAAKLARAAVSSYPQTVVMPVSVP